MHKMLPRLRCFLSSALADDKKQRSRMPFREAGIFMHLLRLIKMIQKILNLLGAIIMVLQERMKMG